MRKSSIPPYRMFIGLSRHCKGADETYFRGETRLWRLPSTLLDYGQHHIRRDPAGNIKRDKEKTTEKIDGAVATVMAFDRAIMCGEGNTESVYDKRGILCCMRLYFFQHLIERTSETIGGDFFPLFLWYYIVLCFFIGYS